MKHETFSSVLSSSDVHEDQHICRIARNERFTVYRAFDKLPTHARGTVVALGNFDGFHRGHHYLVNQAQQLSHSLGRASAILTFSPHPRRVIRGDKNFELLTPDVKALVANELGIDCYFEQHFDKAISQLTPYQFVKEILVDQLAAHAIFVGDDFSFGAGKSGGAQSLAEIAAGFGVAVHIVNRVKDEQGAIYSSTRIRDCIEAGDFIAASALLGRYWQISGYVTAQGDVATIPLGDVIRPRQGEYLAWISMLDDDSGALPTQALVMARVYPSRDTIAIPGVECLQTGTRILVEFVRSI